MFDSANAYTNNSDQTSQRQTRNEGSVTLEKNQKAEKRIPKDEGEYVDYEEVK